MKQHTPNIDPRQKIVAADLHRLNAIEAGLGGRAVKYVFDGDEAGVLETISGKGSGGELEVLRYSACQHTSRARRRLLAQHTPFEFDFARRYAQVLAANFGEQNVPGRTSSPAELRLFFFEALVGLGYDTEGSRPAADYYQSRGLTLTAARKLTSACHGNITDLLDILFQVSPQPLRSLGRRYRSRVQLEPLYTEEAESVILAADAFPSAKQYEIINDLRRLGLYNNKNYIAWFLRQAGSKSKRVREASLAALLSAPENTWSDQAVSLLQSGNLQNRLSMVTLLSSINAQERLVRCRDQQSHQKVVTAIDTALLSLTLAERPSSASSYRAVDGSLIEIPAVQPLAEATWVPGDKEHTELLAVIDSANEKSRDYNAAHPNQRYQAKELDRELAAESVSLFSDSGITWSESQRWRLSHLLSYGPGSNWAIAQLQQIAPMQALRVALCFAPTVSGTLRYGYDPFSQYIFDYLASEDGDLRQLERLVIELGVQYREHGPNTARPPKPGDLLRVLISTPHFSVIAKEWANSAIWPYIAEKLSIIDEAFGLKETSAEDHLQKNAAVDAIALLPKAPAQQLQTLMAIATGEAKSRSDAARRLLHNATNINKQIAALLNDPAQSIRSNAAKWLGDKAAHEAVPALTGQYQVEKSEIVKAACLSSLAVLGENLGPFLSTQTLLDEARSGLNKRKQNKLEWISWSDRPSVRDKEGEDVPQPILEWWTELAVKLKQPAGNPLFDLYLDRLNPEDGSRFASWLLRAWIEYDTSQPTEEEAEFHAHRGLAKRYQTYRRYFKNYTKADALQSLKQEYMSRYPNSGAATKGLLALTKPAPAELAAATVRDYLKHHGSRTSQAGALLEMLAAKKDTATLQVLIASAARSKQKSLQALARELVDKIAEELNWSTVELADRTIPFAGLDDDGSMVLPCGSEAKPYRAKLNKQTLLLELTNPADKLVKALPAGTDDNTKASKKLLSTSRRELKATIQMQQARLYEALCAGRTWPFEAWLRDLKSHPIVSHLVERLIWIAVQDRGYQSFRVDDGNYMSASGQAIGSEGWHQIKLAHSMVLEGQEEQNWMQFFQGQKISPLFPQFGRSMLALNKAVDDQIEINDREGWLTDTFTLRGRARGLGYERGEILDAGSFFEYRKPFSASGISAVINFSGSAVPEENVPAALISLSFHQQTEGRRPKTLKLAAVPRILLSECWNDYRDMASKAEFDPDWRDKVPWM